MRNYTAPLPELFPPPDSLRPTLVGEKYMVVAGHPLVTQVASKVLDAGGNAIDAGVAAGLASNVIQSDMCNLGGVAPIVLRTTGTNAVWSIGGVGVWGGDVTVEKYRQRYLNDMPEGAPCSVVPAALDAWITALHRFGTWSLAEVASEAIDYADNGFVAVVGLVPQTYLERMKARIDYLCEHWDSPEAERVGVGQEMDQGNRAVAERTALTVRKFSGLTPHEPVFEQYMRESKVADVAAELIGTPLLLYGDQALTKPPEVGSEKPFHQDNAYFQVTPDDAVITCWCALDEATPDNG